MYRCPWSVVPAALLAGLLLPSAAVACLWDYDTIRMERTRFPGQHQCVMRIESTPWKLPEQSDAPLDCRYAGAG